MTELTLILGILTTLGSAILVLIKSGLLKISLGKNGNGDSVKPITAKLEEIEGNHLHSIEAKIDDLKTGQEKTNEYLLEAVLILRQWQK